MEECEKPLLTAECVKQKVKDFINKAKVSITVISRGIDEVFIGMFNDVNGMEVEIIHPEDERFPSYTFIIVDGKRVMTVSGSSLNMKPEYRFITEDGIENIERVVQLFSDLEKIFSIEV